jgi:hypothetical protein
MEKDMVQKKKYNVEHKKLGQLFYTHYRAETWSDLIRFYKKLPARCAGTKTKWIFRGQKKYHDECDLSTGLELAYKAFNIPAAQKRAYEEGLIREFQRAAHLYVDNVPEMSDMLEWLLLMRHYGAPTRLLDWTYSFFVAVYFAIIDINDCEKTEGEIWILDREWFSAEKRIDRIIGGKHRMEYTLKFLRERIRPKDPNQWQGDPTFNSNLIATCLMKYLPGLLVYNVTPFRLNEKLIIQQGTFLLHGNIQHGFVENLSEQKVYASKSAKKLFRITIKTNVKGKKEILHELNEMNINGAVLFPGLDGFAKSLRIRLAFPEKL